MAQLSTGIAEGAAGIGWVELQAYKITHAAVDLDTAEEAGTWLLAIQTQEGSGDVHGRRTQPAADPAITIRLRIWGSPALATFSMICTSLPAIPPTTRARRTGAAAKGHTRLPAAAAAAAAARLPTAAAGLLLLLGWVAAFWPKPDSSGSDWYIDDCIGCGGWLDEAEPSFNWGIAGIGAFAARLSGGPDDMPRDVQALIGDVYAIGSGQAGAVGPYTADVNSAGTSMGTDSVTHSIDLSGVAFQSPAPAAIYQGERYGASFAYTLPNLTPGKTYTLRLHFAETYYTTIGGREFNVLINGKQVLTNFDIVAAAGAGFKANIQTFPATATSQGTIVLQFTKGLADWPKVCGIEVY